jgi:hypothetical protein
LGTSPQTVAYGASGSAVTAEPDTGYHFVKWSDDSTDNPRTDTNVTGDITVEASFAIDTFTITASHGAHGAISPEGDVSVAYGGDQTFTITANTGYRIADVLVDGVSVGKVHSYPFTNVTVNHTIAASFAINTHTTNANGGGGSIPPGPTPTPIPTPTPLLPPLESTVFWGIIGGIGHLGEIQSPVTLNPTPATTNTESPTPTSGVEVPWALIVGIIGGMLFVTSFILLILRWFRRPRPD